MTMFTHKYYVEKGPHDFELRLDRPLDTLVVAHGSEPLMRVFAFAANAVADNMGLQAWPNRLDGPNTREYNGPVEDI